MHVELFVPEIEMQKYFVLKIYVLSKITPTKDYPTKVQCISGKYYTDNLLFLIVNVHFFTWNYIPKR